MADWAADNVWFVWLLSALQIWLGTWYFQRVPTVAGMAIGGVLVGLGLFNAIYAAVL